jgi:hypothetical protein
MRQKIREILDKRISKYFIEVDGIIEDLYNLIETGNHFKIKATNQDTCAGTDTQVSDHVKFPKAKCFTGCDMIIQERLSQQIKHGYTVQHDQMVNKEGDFQNAILAVLTCNRSRWPEHWDKKVFEHIMNKQPEDRMVVIGAFAAAEIDRVRTPVTTKTRICYIAHAIGGPDMEKNISDLKRILKRINLEQPDVVPFCPYLADVMSLNDNNAYHRALGIANDRVVLQSGIIHELWLTGSSISSGMKSEIIIAEQQKIKVVNLINYL